MKTMRGLAVATAVLAMTATSAVAQSKTNGVPQQINGLDAVVAGLASLVDDVRAQLAALAARVDQLSGPAEAASVGVYWRYGQADQVRLGSLQTLGSQAYVDLPAAAGGKVNLAVYINSVHGDAASPVVGLASVQSAMLMSLLVSACGESQLDNLVGTNYPLNPQLHNVNDQWEVVYSTPTAVEVDAEAAGLQWSYSMMPGMPTSCSQAMGTMTYYPAVRAAVSLPPSFSTQQPLTLVKE